MTRRQWIDACLRMGDAYEDYPFDLDRNAPDAWTLVRHCQNKKTFAFIYERDGLCLNLKCEPLRAEFLRRVYRDITPGYHMNKTHWNTVRPGGDVPDDVVFALIRQSFVLTAPKDQKQQLYCAAADSLFSKE
jgi:predicted DNA-binding protein (MmcQ/YjbR family)